MYLCQKNTSYVPFKKLFKLSDLEELAVKNNTGNIINHRKQQK